MSKFKNSTPKYLTTPKLEFLEFNSNSANFYFFNVFMFSKSQNCHPPPSATFLQICSSHSRSRSRSPQRSSRKSKSSNTKEKSKTSSSRRSRRSRSRSDDRKKSSKKESREKSSSSRSKVKKESRRARTPSSDGSRSRSDGRRTPSDSMSGDSRTVEFEMQSAKGEPTIEKVQKWPKYGITEPNSQISLYFIP